MNEQATNDKWLKYYNSGKNAKQKDWARISPFYGRDEKTAEYFFYCGFDGVDFNQAVEVLNSKMRDIATEERTQVVGLPD